MEVEADPHPDSRAPTFHRATSERFVRPGATGLLSFVAASQARLRWYRLVLRHPDLRGQPPMRLGPRAEILLEGEGALILGRGVTARSELTITAFGPVRIGDGTFLGRGVNIACYGSVDIGAESRLAERVSIHDSDHVMEPLSDRQSRRSVSLVMPVKIGRRAWLAANVVVVKGVTIGDDVVIAANSVVTRDIPAGSLAAGIPARVIRRLEP